MKYEEAEKKVVSLGGNFHVCKIRKNMKVAQSCPAVCDPMDHTVHGILQARIVM